MRVEQMASKTHGLQVDWISVGNSVGNADLVNL
jgi:hypothetical protein